MTERLIPLGARIRGLSTRELTKMLRIALGANSKTFLKASTLMLACSLFVSAQTASPKHTKKGHTKPHAASQTVSQPVAPPPPKTPAEMPPQPPSVRYSGGLLTIEAANSTLGDILSAIRRATGASIEGPANSTDRVVVQLGPGQPRDVIASLLRGSRYDYILLGSQQQPDGIQKLVLMTRSNQPVSNQPMQSGGSPNAEDNAGAGNAEAANTNPDGSEEEEVPERENPGANAQQPPPNQPQAGATAAPTPPNQNAPQQPQPGQNQPEQQPGAQGGAQPNQPNSQQQVKTPEQLFRELQQLEQQKQQQQQNQQPQ